MIREGYQGMIDGGKHIIDAKWADVSSISCEGGTSIGTSRCPEFLTRDGRLKAAKNLVQREITNLVVIGGDGSLTGANVFKSEWKGLVDELKESNLITSQQHAKCHKLNVVGIVGSIDNDFCLTDITLGANSALHRIVDAIDSIESTAYSHQRTFIFEVMGRHCGYLALSSALAGEAEYLFIPEDPVPQDWPSELCQKLEVLRDHGERLSLIVVAEGAIDCDGKPITTEMIRKVIVDKLRHDTRITVLGHVQRGGMPSAYDLILGARLGAEAVLTVLADAASEQEQDAKVVTLDRNRVKTLPLVAAVSETLALTRALHEKRFNDARRMRGRSFENSLKIFKRSLDVRRSLEIRIDNSLNFAIMHVGAPACGMNAVVHSFVRGTLYRGHKVYGIRDGFDGLVKGNMNLMSWIEVYGWVRRGSAILRTSDTLPAGNFAKVAEKLREFNIHGLVVVGGFEAFVACGQLFDQREHFREFCIPICVIPAGVPNNFPGTEYSIGSDTCLNELTKACFSLRLTGAGTFRVYVVEVMGSYCGYLATLAGLAIGADSIYIPENPPTLEMLVNDLMSMKRKMEYSHISRGLLITNAKASENFNTDFIRRLFAEEGKDIFSTRANIFGHWQLGGIPSPFDRNMGVKMGHRAVAWISEIALQNQQSSDGKVFVNSIDSACILGVRKEDGYMFTPLKDLLQETDFQLVGKRFHNIVNFSCL